VRTARRRAIGWRLGLSGRRGAHSEADESESIMKKGRRWAWGAIRIKLRHPQDTTIWGDKRTTKAL
jgi:hypothetical protein